MPRSAVEDGADGRADAADIDAGDPEFDRILAVTAEALFLTNLLLLPGLAFTALAWLYWNYRRDAGPLARSHFAQTFFVSLWGGVLLVAASAGILMLGGLDWEWTWVIVILYFTCIHSTLVLLGVVGLSRAMAGQKYVYPLIGVRHA